MKNGMTKQKAMYLAHPIKAHLDRLPWWDRPDHPLTLKEIAAVILDNPDGVLAEMRELHDNAINAENYPEQRDLEGILLCLVDPSNIDVLSPW